MTKQLKRKAKWCLAWGISWIAYFERQIEPKVPLLRGVACWLDRHYCHYARASGFKETWNKA